MKTATITLLGEKPISHGGPVAQIVIREPKYKDFMALGDPVIWTRTGEGVIVRAENDDALRQYVERCLEAPKDPLVLDQLDLVDAYQVRAAMVGFFTKAEAAASAKSSTSSSFDSGSSTPSAPAS